MQLGRGVFRSYVLILFDKGLRFLYLAKLFCCHLHSGERKKYYKLQKKAEARHDNNMSLIVDGMDQGKTNLTHWIQSNSLKQLIEI